jgi:diguanylate cyclase (GGDEF)-like protein/PAS domain S-box-containing protein
MMNILERIPYVILMFFSASVSMVLAILALRSRRNVPIAKPFAMMSFCGSLWMVSASLDMLTNNLIFKSILWAIIPFLILSTLIGLFIFSMEFCFKLKQVPKAVLYPLTIISLLLTGFSATNHIHHMIWTVTTINGYYAMVMQNFSWVQMAFTYLLAFASFAMLIRAYLRSKGSLRKQTVYLLAGILIPIFISFAADIFGWDPLPFADEPALSIVITVVLFGWITLRYNSIFKLLPIASDVIIKNMSGAVLVTDSEGLITFCNPAAQLVFGRKEITLNGRNISLVLAEWLPEALNAWNKKNKETRLIFEQEKDILYFNLTITRLEDNSGEFIGHLLILYNITEQKNYEKRLNELAIRDPLTNSYNTRYFYEMAQVYFNQMLRTSKPLSLIMIDLDHFKKINDTYGHLQGDTVIKNVAGVCESLVRPQDIFSRYGGEEFVLAMPETSLEDAMLVAERFRSAVEALGNDAANIAVTVSIGVAQSTGEADLTLDILLNRADKAMYLSKYAGRNCIMAWDISSLKTG